MRWTFLSLYFEKKLNWVFRLFSERSLWIKSKDYNLNTVVAIDNLSNILIEITIPTAISLDKIEVKKTYLAGLIVYSATDIENVASEYLEFFQVFNAEKKIDDFLKVYKVYPKLVKFELKDFKACPSEIYVTSIR